MDLHLHEKQLKALLSPANEILYGGAMGGGKSHLLRVAAIVACVEVPNLQAYIFRRTYKQLIANHIHTPGGLTQLLRPYIDEKLVTYNKSDYSFDFSNGSRLQLAHCQYESDLENHQGAQMGFLGIDEAQHFTEHMLRFLRSRVRLGSIKLSDNLHGSYPKFMMCANPGGVSHNYFKREFITHGTSIWRAKPEDGGMQRQFVPAFLSDNPTLVENDPEYANRLMGLGDPALAKAMLEGNWDIVAGGALDDIWERRTHVIRPFELPRSWHIDRAFDWGSSAPYSVVWFAESDGSETSDGQWFPPGTLFAVHEIYGADSRGNGLRQSPYEIAEAIKLKEMELGLRGRVRPGPADASIFDTDKGESIADIMRKYGVNWVKADKRPGSRVQGLNKLRQMLRASKDKSMEASGFYVFDTCPDLIRTLPVLPRDAKKPEDIDTEAEDHGYDCVRYRVLHKKKQVSAAKVVGF